MEKCRSFNASHIVECRKQGHPAVIDVFLSSFENKQRIIQNKNKKKLVLKWIGFVDDHSVYVHLLRNWFFSILLFCLHFTCIGFLVDFRYFIRQS